MIKLSVVIVSFNTQDLLFQLLKSLKRAIKVCNQVGYSIEVIVVDNHSIDGSVPMVRKEFPWVKLLINKINLGFAKATNQGLLKTKGELVLLLNSDTFIFPDTLKKTIQFIDQNPKIGALTCRVELADGNIDPASHRGFPTPWNAFCYFVGLEKVFPKSRIFAGYHQGWKDLEKIHEIDACSGAFFMIRKNIIDKVGLLDESFFMYGEDLDWAYRIKKLGFKIFYFPKTKIIHFKHRSGIKKVNKNLDKNFNSNQIRKQTLNNFFQAMKLFYKKHYLKRYPFFINKIVFWAIDLLQILLKIKTKYDKNWY